MRAAGIGVDAVFVPEFPAPVTLIALARFAAGLVEVGSEAHIEAHMLGPGMDAVASLEFGLTLGDPNPLHPEGWEMTMLLPLVIEFTAEQDGAHGLELRIDNKVQRDVIWWYVREGEPPAS